MIFKSFVLDPFQELAIHSINNHHSVLVSAPTGSGKTLIADYIIDRDIRQNKKVIYTAPIKALSNQKYRDFCKQYGDDKIGLVTGDVVVNPEANILIMTTEIYRNMAIIKDPLLNDVTYCVMDEIHFISDEERGYIWEESIIFSPEHMRFLFLSATIPNAEEFALWVERIKHHRVEVVRHEERPVPLEIKFFDSELGVTTLDKIRERRNLDRYPEYRHGFRRRPRYHMQRSRPPEFHELIRHLRQEMPCIYFVFSRAKTQAYAMKLAKNNDFLSREEKIKISGIITTEFLNLNKEVLKLRTTLDLRQCLSRGIAFHNAGILPDIKHIVEKLFSHGLIKVLFATETFAVGINMPAKTVCFDNLRKFTGTGFRMLNSKEFFQISGRAGRRGIDKKGLAIALIHRSRDNLGRIQELTTKDIEPLKSQFRLSYNTVLNMINLHSEKEIEQILKMNFHTFQKLGFSENDDIFLHSIKAQYNNYVRELTKLGYIKDGELTELGHFTTKIYSYELEISQIFMGNFELDEYLTLLIVGAIVYEERKDVKFINTTQSRQVLNLIIKLKN
ncbi:DEAD/DEAH box helicase, partial [Candidatus Woesearchaeota archaeon]|nr:DEAD/DEAH box helicase [Candidatus Woesearchaeota archaeon]